jgi:hypothetical protein
MTVSIEIAGFFERLRCDTRGLVASVTTNEVDVATDVTRRPTLWVERQGSLCLALAAIRMERR